ncbi:glycosyltransferase family 87 protein [Paraburkholderia sp. JHI2823]|uniref:glycosyltransferase family 87 protein n=1 Tax=Paraburkholderia sp. JHI2823 TaxID=3112960 RepID=UPI003176E633
MSSRLDLERNDGRWAEWFGWPRNRRWLLFSLLALACFALKVWMTVQNFARLGLLHDQPDFNFFYFAFDTVHNHLTDIGRLYDRGYLFDRLDALGVGIDRRRHDIYGYPPQFAVLLSPLGALGLGAAKIIWLVSGGVLFIASLWMLAAILMPDDQADARRRFFLFSLAIGALSHPLYLELQFGQSNLLIFFLAVSTFYLRYERRNSWLAGVPIGIAIILKMSPAAIALFFLLRKDWRLNLSALLAAVAGTLLTAAVAGWDVLLRYPFESLPAMMKVAARFGPAPWNSSFRGVLERVLADLGLAVPHALVSAVVGLYLLLVLWAFASVTWNTRADRHRDIACAALLPLMVSPVVERTHAMLLIVPVLAMTALVWNRPLPGPSGPERVWLTRHVIGIGVVVAIVAINPIWVSYYLGILAMFFVIVRARTY